MLLLLLVLVVRAGLSTGGEGKGVVVTERATT